MSYESTRDHIFLLNSALRERFNEGDPLTMTTSGDGAKPRLLIHSFEPLSYEVFGTFRNRAPRVIGELALRSLLVARCDDGARVYAGVQAERDGYGFDVAARQLNDIAGQLGYPGTFHEID